MAILQVLSGPLAGQSHELKVEKNTVGRVDDNSIQIADPSVSSHHCEILVQGDEVLVRDLNSTNGTFISGSKITEQVLKPGQVLRLGQVELRLADGTPMPAPSAASAATAPAPQAPGPRPRQEPTVVVQRGITLDQLGEGRSVGFDTATTGFTKKSNTVNRYFIIGGIVLGLIILIGLLYALKSI
jgi:hypothetical protein